MPVYPPVTNNVLAPGLIAKTYYNPVAQEAKQTTSGTFVDMDATNCKISFIAPPSGDVVVKAQCALANDTNAQNVWWCLRDATTSAQITGSEMWMTYASSITRRVYQVRFSGLTPGQTYTWKVAQRVSAGQASAYMGQGSTIFGAFWMEVWDAAPTFSQAANQATANVMAPGLIGSVAYNPVSDVTAILTTTLADVDATNLFVTFIAPPSGKVLVKQSAYGYAAGGNYIYIALRDSSGNIANTSEHVAGGVAAEARWQSSHLVIGLTPGVSYTYKMAAKATVNTTCSIRYGSTAPYGAAVMEVWDAAPFYSTQILTNVRPFKFVNYAAGNLSTSSTSYVDVGLADIVLAAQVGDVIEYGVVIQLSSGVSNLTAVDVVTVAAGAAANATPINVFGGASLLDGVFRNQYADSNMHLCTGSVMYTVVAGDVSTGTVTLRLRWKVNTGTAVITADGQRRAHVWAKNIGQAAA